MAKLRYYPLQETLLKPVYDVRAFSVRRRQVDFWEFKASLDYIESSRLSRATL